MLCRSSLRDCAWMQWWSTRAAFGVGSARRQRSCSRSNRQTRSLLLVRACAPGYLLLLIAEPMSCCCVHSSQFREPECVLLRPRLRRRLLRRHLLHIRNPERPEHMPCTRTELRPRAIRDELGRLPLDFAVDRTDRGLRRCVKVCAQSHPRQKRYRKHNVAADCCWVAAHRSETHLGGRRR